MRRNDMMTAVASVGGAASIYAMWPALSAQLPEAFAYIVDNLAPQQAFGLRLGALPDRRRGDEHRPPCRGEDKATAAFVLGVDFDLHEAAPFQGLEIGCKR